MTEENSQDNDKRAHSVPCNEAQIDTTAAKGFSVKASPFNPVKLELGIILLMGLLLILVVHRISDNVSEQLVILLGFGVISMFWLIRRIRQVVQQQTHSSGQVDK